MGTIPEKICLLKDGRHLVVRTGNQSDAEAYLLLAKSIMDEEIYSLTQAQELQLTVDQQRNWLSSKIENQCHLAIVAVVAGELVGQLDFSNGHRQRIFHTGEFGMGVKKSYRGLGIGAALLTSFIDWAKDHSEIEKINLCVHQTNERAISMYKKFGFQIEGVRTKDLKYSKGIYVDTVLMGLRL